MLNLLNLILVMFFVLMNAFFVVAEFSMVKIRKSQVDMMVVGGQFGAKYAKLITDNLNAYLSACQLGITLASLALGWIGEPALAAIIGPMLSYCGVPEVAVHGIAFLLGFSIISTLHIVLGELVPKSLAILSTEKYVLFSAFPLWLFYRLTYPVMWLFNTVTNSLLRLAGHTLAEEEQAYSDAELKILMDESCRSGLFAQEKYDYVDNIFELEEKDAESIMTPRRDVVCLYTDDSLANHLQTAMASKFTRYPVCNEDKDDMIGFVHIKDLFTLAPEESIQTIIREILVVPESTPVSKLLHLFKQDNTKLAVVIDEHGGTAGIATLSDAIAEIVGDIEDEYTHGEEDLWQTLAPDRYLVSGSASVDLLEEHFGLILGDTFEAETIGGFLLELFQEFPEIDAETTYGHFTFIIKAIDDKKIETIEIDVKTDSEN